MRSPEKLPSTPAFVRGEIYERATLHDAYGGNPVKGISRPAHHDVILLFASPDAHYEDVYREDGSIVYHGQGAESDMEWEAENVYLRDHEETGHDLHFFRGREEGGYEYLGEYFVDSFWTEEGPDPAGGTREVIKFHLRPVRHRREPDPDAGVASSDSEGQGYQSSKAIRDAIERLAVRRASRYFERQGWEIEDVGDYESYDLRCSKLGDELHVEVKGTAGSADSVHLTANEVEHAEDQHPETALFVLSNVEIDDRETAEVSGGEKTIWHPWQVTEGELEPTRYRYRPPATSGQSESLVRAEKPTDA